jgi:hypothetical protein
LRRRHPGSSLGRKPILIGFALAIARKLERV